MRSDTKNRRSLRAAVWAAGVGLAIVTFSPLVIPRDRVEPRLAAMPYTLWAGIVVTILYVGLTAAAAWLRSDDGSDIGGRQP